MIIGVVGPTVSLKMLERQTIAPTVQFLPLPYREFRESVQLVKEHEQKCDALLFTGPTPYFYASSLLQPTIPWDYLPRNVLSVMSALVRASLDYKNRVINISMDGFSPAMIDDILRELREIQQNLHITNTQFDIMSDTYFTSVVRYHLENFHAGRADLCITGLQKILEKLHGFGVPAVKVGPNAGMLQQKVLMLMMKSQITMSQKLQAVLVFEPEYQLTSAMHGHDGIRLIRLRAGIEEAVYHFAQQLGASLFKTERNWYLVCDSQTLLTVTDGFSRICQLPFPVMRSETVKIYAGIGMGRTSGVAQYAADRALAVSRKNSATECYGYDEEGRLFGPVPFTGETEGSTSFSSNLELNKISVQTGIGIASLKKIEQALMQCGSNTITASDLASACSLSLRSMNRLLQKLDEFHYVSVLGKEPQESSGRPRRLMHIDLNYHE